MISFRKSQIFPIGLQVEPHSITLAQLRERLGRIELFAFARAEYHFPDDLSDEERDQRYGELIRELLASSRFKGRRVVSCLGMDELFVQNVRLPKFSDEETEKMLHWEAAERLPYPIETAEIRHWLAAEMRQSDGLKQEVILAACPQKTIQRQINRLELAGLSLEQIDVEPCAVLRSLQIGYGEEWASQRNIIVHFGRQATSIFIESAGRIQFLKKLDAGGEQYDQLVADHLNIPLHDASQLRATVTTAETLDDNDSTHQSIIDAIRISLEAAADEIERCLRYDKVTFREKSPEKIIITGSEAPAWITDFLSDRLRIDCELADPLQEIDCQLISENLPSQNWHWATILGLSYQNQLA